MSKQPETELCFYARIGNPAGLEQAVSQEVQSQFTYNIPDSEDGKKRGRIRVRSTAINGDTKYEECLKVPQESGFVIEGCVEYPIPITKDYFDAWIAAYGVKGVDKIRYVFLSKEVILQTDGVDVTLPEVKYEVDVFLDEQGNRSIWCKIDIEIDGIMAYLSEHHPEITRFDTTVKLSSLPINPEDAFSAVTEDEEQKAAIKSFWDKFSHYPKKVEAM